MSSKRKPLKAGRRVRRTGSSSKQAKSSAAPGVLKRTSKAKNPEVPMTSNFQDPTTSVGERTESKDPYEGNEEKIVSCLSQEKIEGPQEPSDEWDYEEDYEDDFEDFDELEELEGATEQAMLVREGRSTSKTSVVVSPKAEAKEKNSSGKEMAPPPSHKARLFLGQDKADQLDFFPSRRSSTTKEILGNKGFGVDVGHKKKRQIELLASITLEESQRDVFSQPSLRPWEFYLKRLGSGRVVRQVGTQTNEDARSMGLQTDKPVTKTQEMNAPIACSSEALDRMDSTCALSLRNLADVVERILVEEARTPVRNGFNESSEEKENKQFAILESTLKLRAPCVGNLISFSLGYKEFNGTEVLGAYVADSNSTLVLWNIEATDQPRKFLHCPVVISHCILIVSPLSLALAATNDGNLYAWDVSRAESSQLSAALPGRHDTCSSGCAAGKLVDLRQVTRSTDHKGTPQVATLFEYGHIVIWTVSHAKQPGAALLRRMDSIYLETIKLLPVATIDVSFHQRPGSNTSRSGLPQCSSICFWPYDPNKFAVCCGFDGVVCKSRSGAYSTQVLRSKAHPGSVRYCVTSFDVNPYLPQYVILGYSDGSVRLFSTDACVPIREWLGITKEEGFEYSSVKSVSWSPTRGTVFFVLDELDNCSIWDLSRSTQAHVCTASGSHLQTCAGTSGQQAILALASNESICLHKLSQEVSKSIDSKQIAAIMGNI